MTENIQKKRVPPVKFQVCLKRLIRISVLRRGLDYQILKRDGNFFTPNSLNDIKLLPNILNPGIFHNYPPILAHDT